MNTNPPGSESRTLSNVCLESVAPLTGHRPAGGTGKTCGGNGPATRTATVRAPLQPVREFHSVPADRVPAPLLAPVAPPPPSAGRRLLFRCVRLALMGAVVAGAGAYSRYALSNATSEQAYITGDMTVLRAPIGGHLRMEAIAPGTTLSRGAVLFHIENARFGNQEAMAQLNWLQELTGRLQAEADEAAVRSRQQQQIYELHEKLFEEKLISRLAFIEEETKLALARTALTNKWIQAREAQRRAAEVEHQVKLQKEAMVQMPFDGVAWTMPAQTDGDVAAFEPVLQVMDPRTIRVDAFFAEKQARKLRVGDPVTIRPVDGGPTQPGRVASIRAGVGRLAFDQFSAALPGAYNPRRVAVRISIEAKTLEGATEFFGVGRSVVVAMNRHE